MLLGFTMPVASSNDAIERFDRIHMGHVIGGGSPLTTQDPVQAGSLPQASVTLNPLTGLPMDESFFGRRPLAISLSNSAPALPMNGISNADIVYEVLVEGGITRMLALYQDFTNAGLTGSIRSARHYTVSIAESYDAIFVSAGGSPQAYEEIESRGIAHLDEVAGNHSEMFYRDVNRIRGRTVERYHSAVTTGALVTRWLPSYGIRMMHNERHTNALFFVDDGTPPGGGNAQEVVVRFAAGNTSTFSYNNERRIYHMHQPSGIFIDENDNSQPAFTNLLILKTSVAPIPGDGAGRLEIITTGSGTGYFACGGRFIEINWFRANKSSPFVYMLRDGSVLTLGRGNTYIGIIPTEMNVTFR